MDILLASGSPRRKELLTQMGLSFTVCPADVDETIAPGTAPDRAVAELSQRKARAVATDHPAELILAADTVVALDDAILGKPHSPDQALAMLRALSGRTHEVYTGFTLQRGARVVTQVERTLVTFRTLTDDEIAAYVSTGEPMDKAGAYGIQGIGSLLVQGIQGDYFNVMGLPVCRLGLALGEFGINALVKG